MAKILMLEAYYRPEKTPNVFLEIDRTRELVKNGHKVIVCTPIPSRGVSDKEREKYKKIKKEYIEGKDVLVYRFQLIKENKNPILRALRYFLSCVYQFFYGVLAYDTRDVDMMLITSTPPIQGAMASLVRKIRKIPIVYILQDIFPDSLVGAGMTHEGSLIWKIGRVVENYTYRNCDKIIVISQDFKRNIMAKGVPEEKIEVIYNWVDENAIVPIAQEDNILYDEFSLPKDRFYVVYAGNFGNAQNIDIIIRVAEQIKDYPNIQFLLFGTGGLIDDFKKLVSELNLDNVRFFPLQPYNRISYVYSLGNVGIVSCKKGIGKGAMPSKTWSIMSAGTPVVASYDANTDLQRIIETYKSGLFSEADNVEALADAILYMYNNPILCKEYGINARRYVERNLTKEVGTSRYVEVVKQILSKSSF